MTDYQPLRVASLPTLRGLTLTIHEDNRVRIETADGPILIALVRVGEGRRARICIDAPRSTRIDRIERIRTPSEHPADTTLIA